MHEAVTAFLTLISLLNVLLAPVMFINHSRLRRINELLKDVKEKVEELDTTGRIVIILLIITVMIDIAAAIGVYVYVSHLTHPS